MISLIHSINELAKNPLEQFKVWYEDAVQSRIKFPDAMILATCTPNGIPSARTVLYKGINHNGIRFFTNYNSRKGKELLSNPLAAVVFYWSKLDRQVRMEGKIETLSPKESDEYWLTRPRESRFSALASPQSQPISEKQELEKKITSLASQFNQQEIPRPSHWGGFLLIPDAVEFWTAGDHRLHDRFLYQKENDHWKITQLAP